MRQKIELVITVLLLAGLIFASRKVSRYMTLHSTYHYHRRKLVTWYSSTQPIMLERMSPMWESMQETTECITLATLLDMQI